MVSQAETAQFALTEFGGGFAIDPTELAAYSPNLLGAPATPLSAEDQAWQALTEATNGLTSAQPPRVNQ